MSIFESKLLALNYFSSNRTCQIFLTITYAPEIVSSSNSTLIILQMLSTPCYSNLPLLLKRIKLAQQPTSISVSNPTFLSINSANNLLAVMSYMGSRTLFNRKNLSSVINITSVGSDCAIASQNDNLFISSCDNPYSVRIYNETINGLRLLYVLNITDNVRQVVFIENNTWLLIAFQYLNVIQMYSVDLKTNKFIYNQSISIPYNLACTLTKHNDTLIYICFWKTGVPVHILSFNGSLWIVSNLTVTRPSNMEIVSQVAFDSYDRLWAVVYGYGIRIYDTMGQTLLASWPISSAKLDALTILNTYEIFFGDYDNNKILHFAPVLECIL
ncbi:hypothetical protein I4U23_008768 [Adineta vaga]|nr:hypothetical protein I4U23_008768 [Adineta vaga]